MDPVDQSDIDLPAARSALRSTICADGYLAGEPGSGEISQFLRVVLTF